MTVEVQKSILAALCIVFGVATLIFIYRDMQVPGFFSITGMLVCRYGMWTTK